MRFLAYLILATFVPGMVNPLQAHPQNLARDTKAQQCLALAMYWEARGEGASGMLAVGLVVKNRALHRQFPDTICGVVFQGGETPPCQFSWWCDGRSDRPGDLAQWRFALKMADEVLLGRTRDPTRGALFFHAVGVKSPWHRQRQRTVRIGEHVFYR